MNNRLSVLVLAFFVLLSLVYAAPSDIDVTGTVMDWELEKETMDLLKMDQIR